MVIGKAHVLVPTAGRELTARHQTLSYYITNLNYLSGVKCRMAATAVIPTSFSLVNTKKSDFLLYLTPPLLASSVCICHASSTLRKPTVKRRTRRTVRSQVAGLTMFSGNPVVGDLVATVLSGGIALSCLRFWEEIAKRGYFDQVGSCGSFHSRNLFFLSFQKPRILGINPFFLERDKEPGFFCGILSWLVMGFCPLGFNVLNISSFRI